MEAVFSRSPSTGADSVSVSGISRRVINSEEIIIEDFDKSVDNWNIPKKHADDIYQKPSVFYKWKHIFIVKTEERNVHLTKHFQAPLSKLTYFVNVSPVSEIPISLTTDFLQFYKQKP